MGTVRVLLISDDPSVVDVMTAVADEAGLSLTVVVDARSAAAQLKQTVFAIAILDVSTVRLNDLLALRGQDSWSDPKFVLIGNVRWIH